METTFLCSECAREFDANTNTEECPFCKAYKDSFVMIPINVPSECETFLNLYEE